MFLEGFFLGPRAKAGRFGKAGIAHGAARYQAVRAHAQVYGHRAIVTIGAGGDAVAHHLIAILGGVQAGHLVPGGHGDFLVILRGHHRIEGIPQGGRSALLNGALGDHIGHGEGNGGNQGDDAQDDIRRQSLFPGGGAVFLVHVGGIVFHGTKSLHHGA